jgi:hypothetical protein
VSQLSWSTSTTLHGVTEKVSSSRNASGLYFNREVSGSSLDLVTDYSDGPLS